MGRPLRRTGQSSGGKRKERYAGHRGSLAGCLQTPLAKHLTGGRSRSRSLAWRMRLEPSWSALLTSSHLQDQSWWLACLTSPNSRCWRRGR